VDVGDYRFVAPDNGVLSAVFLESPPKRVVELTERKYSLPTISRTFEGRDRFAPAAASWQRASRSSRSARPSGLPHDRSPRPSVSGTELSGEVVRVDRFGNLITNIDRRSFEQLAEGRAIAVVVGGREVPRIVATYADAPPGELCALFGSTDHLEVAINGGDAARTLGLDRGAAAKVRLVQ
jgi:S-adenosylmethionine hydrolase